MKKSLMIFPIFLSVVFISSWTRGILADTPLSSATTEEVQTQQQEPNIILKKITYNGSDSPAIGDPLGNGALSHRDNVGPPDTQGPAFGKDCQSDSCQRAEKRWMSKTTWRQDRAMGLSVGWGEK